MKKILFILLPVVLVAGCASLTKPLSDEFTKTIIVETSHKNDKSFVIVNEWLTETINDARSSIEFSDKDDGKIIGDIIIETLSYDIKINYNITIKDKKIRLILKPRGVSYKSTNWYTGNVSLSTFAFYFVSYSGKLSDIKKQEQYLSKKIESISNSFEEYLKNYNEKF